MHFSTRQCLCPLVRLDKRFLGPLPMTPCINEIHFSTRPPSYTTRHNIIHIPNQMHFFKVNSETTSCNNTAGNYLTSVAKHTSKTIENVPLERVEKALSLLVQVKSIGQPSNLIQTKKLKLTKFN